MWYLNSLILICLIPKQSFDDKISFLESNWNGLDWKAGHVLIDIMMSCASAEIKRPFWTPWSVLGPSYISIGAQLFIMSVGAPLSLLSVGAPLSIKSVVAPLSIKSVGAPLSTWWSWSGESRWVLECVDLYKILSSHGPLTWAPPAYWPDSPAELHLHRLKMICSQFWFIQIYFFQSVQLGDLPRRAPPHILRSSNILNVKNLLIFYSNFPKG